MEVSSPAFSHWSYIPKKYTCDGDNINPPLEIHKIPRDAKSLVLLMDDTYDVTGTRTHWLVWNIDPREKIAQGSVPGMQGLTDFGIRKYTGPCQVTGKHAFHFRIFALDKRIALDPSCGKQQLEKVMTKHMMAFGFIAGIYERNIKGIESIPAQISRVGLTTMNQALKYQQIKP